MEVPQGNFQCSYFKQAKCLLFSFFKIREQESRIGPAWECWYQWEGGGSEERV
jgi:hypothetical protein